MAPSVVAPPKPHSNQLSQQAWRQAMHHEHLPLFTGTPGGARRPRDGIPMLVGRGTRTMWILSEQCPLLSLFQNAGRKTVDIYSIFPS